MEDLTKWPRLTVVGEAVTPEQADEILIRTNDWYDVQTNLPDWERDVSTVAAAFGWPRPVPWFTSEGDRPPLDTYSARVDALERWKARWGVLDLTYMGNERVASQWMGGAHGWCDWAGRIGSTCYNVGKWPSYDEVRSDWEQIATAFPYLRLRAQLWPDEGEAPRPAVEYRVSGGKVAELTGDLDPIPPGRDGMFTDEWWAARREVKGGIRDVERGCTRDRLELAFTRLQLKMIKEGWQE